MMLLWIWKGGNYYLIQEHISLNLVEALSIHPVFESGVAVAVFSDVPHHLLRVEPEVAELALYDLPTHTITSDAEVL